MPSFDYKPTTDDASKIAAWNATLDELDRLIDNETDPIKKQQLIEEADGILSCGPF